MIITRRSMLAAPALLLASTYLGGWRSGNLPCDIIALVGDSNTYSGQNADGSAGYNPAIDVTNPSCLEYRNPYQNNSKNFIDIAQDQFAYNNAGVGSGYPVGSIGCCLTAMRDWWRVSQLAVGRNVMFVACGIGGTKSGDWDTGGTQQATAYTRISQAVAQNAGNKLVLIITSLGTNDAIGSISSATFTSNMQTFATNYRNPTNVTGASSTTPIIFNGLVPAWAAGGTGTSVSIAAAITALPSTISKSAAVNMSNLDGMGTAAVGQNAIPYHYTAATQRLIGNPGLANAYGNLS